MPDYTNVVKNNSVIILKRELGTLTCKDLLLDPLFERDNIGGLLFVAPLPARRLFNSEGLLAQMKA